MSLGNFIMHLSYMWDNSIMQDNSFPVDYKYE